MGLLIQGRSLEKCLITTCGRTGGFQQCLVHSLEDNVATADGWTTDGMIAYFGEDLLFFEKQDDGALR
jgi:hypothetical protein